VQQLDLKTDKVIETFPSMRLAATAIGGHASNISKVIKGDGNSYLGYAWKLQFEHQKDEHVFSRAVEKISLESGEVLESFTSISEAAAMTDKASRSTIITVMKGKGRSSGGFFWREVGTDTLPPPRLATSAPAFCYLLSSSNPEYPDKTYAGYTIDPLKRLDQHNGLKKGAAKATIEARPWEMRLVVEGFPCRSTARKLLCNWERLGKSRWTKKPDEKNVLEGDMIRLKILLTACPVLYTDISLKIHFLNAQDLQMFEAIVRNDLPDTVEYGVLSSLSSLKKPAPAGSLLVGPTSSH
jgi:predicted GIY-YIG superfamily endonuclease